MHGYSTFAQSAGHYTGRPFPAFLAIVRAPYAVVVAYHPADQSAREQARRAAAEGAVHILMMPGGTTLSGCARAIAKAAGRNAYDAMIADGYSTATAERAQERAETEWAVRLAGEVP